MFGQLEQCEQVLDLYNNAPFDVISNASTVLKRAFLGHTIRSRALQAARVVSQIRKAIDFCGLIHFTTPPYQFQTIPCESQTLADYQVFQCQP
jgi:hypothetical protein